MRGLVSAVSVTSLYYVVRRLSSRAAAMEMLGILRACVGLTPCDAAVLHQAMDAGFHDFEDAVQWFSARAAAADVLVTRNTGRFPGNGMPVMTPVAFLAAHSFA